MFFAAMPESGKPKCRLLRYRIHVVPPLMPRDSVKAADIDGVTLRRISVKDLVEGILMPEEKVEGVELIRVDAAKADRCCLRAGDILMPRMLPRHKYANYMVANVEHAE